jgi:hypothetical protein
MEAKSMRSTANTDFENAQWVRVAFDSFERTILAGRERGWTP